MNKTKQKGIIRKSFLLPFLFFICLILIFNFFFLDPILKNSIEYISEEFHLAEVNIRRLRTRFFDLSVEVQKVEFTDKKEPTLNQFEIGNIKFALKWDALLRAKFVVDIADLGDIKVGTKRSSRGRIFDRKQGDTITEKTLDNAKKEFEGNVFADISALVGGTSIDDVGESITSELESEKILNQIERDIELKEKEIADSFKSLPTKKNQVEFQKRLAKIKWKDLGNLLKAPGVLREVDSLRKEIDTAKKSITSAKGSIQSSISTVDQSYKQVNKSIEDDIRRITKRAKIPKLDTKSIARVLFGRDLVNEVLKYKNYFDTAKTYIPEKADSAPASVKRKRRGGKYYYFGNQKSYPLFWLKKLQVESENAQGHIYGEILNITTNQNQINSTTKINLKGDLPLKSIFGFNFTGDIDLREAPFMLSELKIKSIPVMDKKLSDSKESRFVIKKASNQINLNSKVSERDLRLVMESKLTKIDYETSSNSKQIGEILKEVSRKTKVLTLKGSAKGAWDDIRFDLSSNLGVAIQKSVGSIIQDKINEAKKKIKNQVELRISKKRKKIKEKADKLKAQFQSKINEAQLELDKLKTRVDKEKKSALKKAKKSGGNLLRNIKF